MKLIAVISHKGGAGKTTSAVQLAEELARRGQRTLLVDADRQQGAGLLLGIDAPAGCVQRTMVPQLDYLGSARLTDLEIADCFASVANRFDVGVVDTPSLDDALARAWLREAAAALMVLQVDPLTVKTLPSALNTLEVVRAFKPSIQILGLLPTMFDQHEAAHGKLLAELLSRRPEAVFTPVVPQDPGLMHRANREDCPPVGDAALQAYQCAVDRILRALDTAAPSVKMPRAAVPSQPPGPQSARPVAPQRPVTGGSPASGGANWGQPARPMADHAAPATASGGGPIGDLAREPASGDRPWHDPADAALEMLAGDRETPRPPSRPGDGSEAIPDWWKQPGARVDDAGVARRTESWLVRSRFAIACTVACLALIAAVVMGTLKRSPLANGQPVSPAVAASAHTKEGNAPETAVAPHAAGRKPAAKGKHSGSETTGKVKGE